MVDGSSGVDGGYRAHRAAFVAFAERSRKGDHRAALAAAHAAHDQVLAAGHPDLRGMALNCVGLARFELGEFAAAAESRTPRRDAGGSRLVRQEARPALRSAPADRKGAPDDLWHPF
ncbi:hypothetical protein [Nonomuraea sp. JJY05]|uniref:hypothetical protein n=1 Tax=Nonomuraea sp. JJY05 TaxID=3350255 RepID=UPI00373F318C